MFVATASAGFGANSSPWQIGAAFNENMTLSVSAQDANPETVFISDDGAKLYEAGLGGIVNQYVLARPWVVKSGEFQVAFESTAVAGAFINGVAFGLSGTKLFTLTGTSIIQHTLSTAWASSTATPDGVTFSCSSEDSAPEGIHYKADGLKFWMAGRTNDRIFEYTMTTAWASSTAAYSGVSFGSSAEDVTPRDIWIKPDGLRAFVLGDSNNAVFEYAFTEPFASSTVTYSGKSFALSTAESAPSGFFFKPDGTRFFVVGNSADAVRSYGM